MREKIREILKSYPWQQIPALPGRTNKIQCGVLVPITFADNPKVYAGQRSMDLTNHAGEICFPGGRPEENDSNLQATAIREAEEEMGISDVEIMGRLSSIPVYTSDYRLEPFVGVLGQAPKLPDGNEIIRIHTIDLVEVLDRPCINCIPWPNDEGTHLSPVFEIDDRLMFGATAYVMLELLELVAPLVNRSTPERRPGPYTWDDVLSISKTKRDKGKNTI